MTFRKKIEKKIVPVQILQATPTAAGGWMLHCNIPTKRNLAEAPTASATAAEPVKYICETKMLRAFIKIN